MRKPVRRAIFYGFIVIFIIITPFLILYTLGYSVNLAERSLVPTGGFFVKTNVSGIKISVDGQLQKETFLLRGAMINGLAPGLISVEITKDGFYPWRKSVEIKEQLIQEFRSILLIPQLLTARTLLGTTTPAAVANTPQELVPNPEGTRLAVSASEKNRTVLRIIDAASGAPARSAVIFPASTEIQKISWNENGTSLLVKKNAGGTVSWEIIPASERPSVALLNDKTRIPVSGPNPEIKTITRNLASAVRWSPASSDEFYIQAGTEVYRWDLSQNRAARILENVHSFEIAGGGILFATQNGFLAESDLDGKVSQTLDRPGVYISDKPFTFLKNSEGSRAVIDSAGGLYLENRETHKFIPVEGSISRARFADNAAYLVYAKGGVIGQVLLADETKQPFRKKYEKTVILDAVTPIRDFIWFGKDSTHLIFITENGAFIAENDSRFGANATTLKTGKYLIASFPQNPNTFYLTDGKTIEEITIQ